VLGVAVMAVALVAAIAKPWEAAPTAPRPAPSLVAVTAPEQASTPSPAPRITPSAPDWLEITSVVTAHHDWGVTAVLAGLPGGTGLQVSPQGRRYAERWTGTSTDSAGVDFAYVDRDDRSIAALGVTVPSGEIPRSVRIWRLHQGNELEWMNAARIDDLAASPGPLLVRMPLIDGVASAPWDAGQYRVDVLTSNGIHRISVFIPNRFGSVPRPDAWAPTASGIVAATASDPSAVRIGLFATVDGTAVAIPARESAPLGEAQAWGDLAASSDATVAAMYLPRATGLGVMLTPHAALRAATIRRLAPDPLPDPPPVMGGVSESQGRTPYVVFPAPDGRVWEPGVYAVSVDWTDAAGRHEGTWHVELRPGIG